jgi:putative endonuclease
MRHRARRKRETATFASGRRGEDIAHRYLQSHGYLVVARNFRTRSGSAEVDIVAHKADAVVFVEVKARDSNEFGPPDRGIDHEKQFRIMKAAVEYLRRADVPDERARFDVINIILGGEPSLEHIEDAFYFPRAV